jgi:hypothetical protein
MILLNGYLIVFSNFKGYNIINLIMCLFVTWGRVFVTHIRVFVTQVRVFVGRIIL